MVGRPAVQSLQQHTPAYQITCLQVIPKAGGTVLILAGKHCGESATVERILTDDFQVELALPSGKRAREEYECVCKLLQ